MGQQFFSTWSDSGSLFAGAGATILMYHKIGHPPPTTRSRALYLGAGLLRRQLRQLREAELSNAPLGDAMDAASRDGRVFCVTFDDGFKSVLDHALKILAAERVCATQFLVAGLLGRNNRWDIRRGETPEPLMDTGEVREWLAAGQEIGSHTLTHPRLTILSPGRARAQIVNSKKMLEDLFGVPVRHFCYPYGEYNERIRDFVAEAGYTSACTTDFGRVKPGAADSLLLPRVMARYSAPPGWLGKARGFARQASRWWTRSPARSRAVRHAQAPGQSEA